MNIKKTGIEYTEAGQIDGFSVSMLAYDHREFNDILFAWIDSEADGSIERFIHSLGLDGELTENDVIQLLSGDKAPDRELAHFLSACVPEEICSWLVLRNRAYKAASLNSEQIVISARGMDWAKRQRLQLIAQDPQNYSIFTITEWLTEKINEISESRGQTVDAEQSIKNIAELLGLSSGELKGEFQIKGRDIPEVAEELVSLFNLQNEDFDEAVSFVSSAWNSADLQKVDLAMPRMMRFLRHSQGLTQQEFSNRLGAMKRDISGIESATILLPDGQRDKLISLLEIKDDDVNLFVDASKQYNKRLKSDLQERLEPVVTHFAAYGLTIDALINAAEKISYPFNQEAEVLIGKIERVVRHFEEGRLDLSKYLQAAVESPDLFYLKPETLISNIEAVAGHFEKAGLELFEYLKAATKAPQLFYQKPETLIGNIERVAAHFEAEGLELSKYLKAAVDSPSIFYQKPETLIGNIERVVAHFKDDGIELSKYLRAAVKCPSLFYQKPETLIKNIEDVVSHFEEAGLELSEYLKAAMNAPQLFYQNPETLIGNIEGVVNHFERDGLKLPEYLKAAVKMPTLFRQKPETLISHINRVVEMYDKEFFVLNVSKKNGNQKQPDPDSRKPIFDMIVTNPVMILLADDNYLLRSFNAAATGGNKSSRDLFRTPRGAVEEQLMVALGHGDASIPVPKIEKPSLTGEEDSVAKEEEKLGPYARNLLLRALIREGLIKGELENQR